MRKFSLPRRWRRQSIHIATRHIIILGTLGILLAAGAIGGRLLGVFAQPPCAASDQTYIVAGGNTLAGIAARYNTTWWRLASYNHLSNANLIFVGQAICIPSRSQGSGMAPSNLKYMAVARQDALDAGIPPDAFVRQIIQESGFNPSAISPAGAIGIAQFEPATAAGLGIDPNDPIASLKAAAGLMANYVRQYGGDYAKALAAYNAGPGTVQAAVQTGGADWRTFLPAETQNYIRIILG
jgi:soluble lytic murein transglycosylase-like protein